MTILRYVRLLPLLVIVSMLSFAARVGDFMARSGAALAQQEVAEGETPPMPADTAEEAAVAAKEAEEKSADAKSKIELPKMPAIPKEGTAEEAPKAVTEEIKPTADGDNWRDAGDTQFEHSEVRDDFYKDVAARRKDIEKREKDMKVREALLEAAERELDQKYQELTMLRNEIQGLLKQQSTEEAARIGSLVKIYEGMKAKDAANIFNTLEMDVLIEIMMKMSERKSGPILAEMEPERARNVTILMAEQRSLPSLDAISPLAGDGEDPAAAPTPLPQN